jgi:hypothetical protein
MEIARRGDIKIFAKIIAQPFLCRPTVPVLDPGVGIVDPLHRKRQVLAHMAEVDLESAVKLREAS